MFDRLKSLLRAPEQKASRTARLIALESGGRARWTPRDYAALTREGYTKNAIVHRAVRLIAESVGGLSFLLYEGAAEHAAHPLLDLMARPNPRQDGASFLESVTAHLLLAGNAYIEAVAIAAEAGSQDTVRELYALRPDRMKVVPGPDGWPQAFEYTVSGQTVRFDQSAAQPPILQLTLFNPLDDYYGLSPLEAAAVAVDTHNAAAKWNKALLDNAARPSGALVYAGADGSVLADAQFERIKKELGDLYQGAGNAGRPMVLEGGLDWKAMSLIAQGHGLHGGQAFRGARDRAGLRRAADAVSDPRGQYVLELSRSQSCVLARRPCCRSRTRVGAALTQWLAPSFGEGLTLAVDTDRIEALSARPRCAVGARHQGAVPHRQ